MYAKKVWLLALLLLFAPAITKSFPQSRAFKVPFTQFTLDNGLRVVVSEDHSAPVIAVVVCYDVGSRNEVKGRTGFAHLFEHMMFQGSENVGKAEHFKYVEGNGGIMNATTFQDYTIYYNLLPSNQLELALWLESDRMRSLKITEENLKNQKEAVKEEKRLSYDNQAYWPALLKMDEMVFSNWSNSHPVIGSMEDLDAATIADVKAFFDTYYAPDNAALAIAGDVDLATARSLAARYFGTIARSKNARQRVDVSEPEGVAVKQTAVVADRLAETPALAISWKTPPRRTTDFHALVLLKSALFDGESARLYRELVKDKALSLDLSATLEERRGPGQITIVTKHKSAISPASIENAIWAEIAKVQRDGISADELTKAKNQLLLGRFSCASVVECTGLQTALGRGMALAEYLLFDGDPSLINSEMDEYLSVTPELVKAAARKYFTRDNTAVLHIEVAKERMSGEKEGEK